MLKPPQASQVVDRRGHISPAWHRYFATLTAAPGEEGEPGEAGPAGPVGPEGPPGPAGADATGDVVGPATATDDAVALYDGTTGKLLQDSTRTIASIVTEATTAATAAIVPVDLATETTGTLPLGSVPAHHATHDTGGSDALTALSADIVTSGTLSDARLSGNVALENVANVFTIGQTIESPTTARLILIDTSAPTDAKRFDLFNLSQSFGLGAVNDAGAMVVTPFLVTRSGDVTARNDIYEKQRTAPMGHWIDVPFNAANFSGSAPMTWTVAAGNIVVNSYWLVGNTLWWSVAISGSTLGGAISSLIELTIPNGMTTNRAAQAAGRITDTVGRAALVFCTTGSTFVRVVKEDVSNFTLGSLGVGFQIALSIP